MVSVSVGVNGRCILCGPRPHGAHTRHGAQTRDEVEAGDAHTSHAFLYSVYPVSLDQASPRHIHMGILLRFSACILENILDNIDF